VTRWLGGLFGRSGGAEGSRTRTQIPPIAIASEAEKEDRGFSPIARGFATIQMLKISEYSVEFRSPFGAHDALSHHTRGLLKSAAKHDLSLKCRNDIVIRKETNPVTSHSRLVPWQPAQAKERNHSSNRQIRLVPACGYRLKRCHLLNSERPKILKAAVRPWPRRSLVTPNRIEIHISRTSTVSFLFLAYATENSTVREPP
jgi:hypothetical protein